jgi:hypothetical protein
MNPILATIESAAIFANGVQKMRKEKSNKSRYTVALQGVGLLGSTATLIPMEPTLHIDKNGAHYDDGKRKDHIPAPIENTLSVAVTAINLAQLALPGKNLKKLTRAANLARLGTDLYVIAQQKKDKK